MINNKIIVIVATALMSMHWASHAGAREFDSFDTSYRQWNVAFNEPEAFDVSAFEKKPVFVLENNDQHFEEPLFNGNKVHQYLGIGSLVLVGVAMLAPKVEDQLHEHAARGAAFLGAAAVTSGLITHWDDYDIDEGLLDPDNLHIMLASTGVLGLIFAVAEGPDSPHAGVGAIAGITMAVGMKLSW